MKPGSNRRPRSRPNNSNSNNNNKRQGGKSSYDSNGPDGKVRGTAQQVLEKYQALGRDATSAGDRIAAEAYFQFAEHYYRVVSADGGMQQPRREQHASMVSENEIVENEKVALSPTVSAFSSDTAQETTEELLDIEVINVPIMPGPITLPIGEEETGVGPLNLQTQVSVASENDEDDCKPKPVRRRRVKSKPIEVKSETETESEIRPVDI
jgi:hypothetical protein